MKNIKISILVFILLILPILLSVSSLSIPMQLSDQGTSVKDMAGQNTMKFKDKNICLII